MTVGASNDFVMISNLKGDEEEETTLHLAETVSRATANELKNVGLKGEEFYGALSTDPRLFQSVYQSDMVIFEGHSNHFFLYESARGLASLSAPSLYLPQHPFIILQSCNSVDDGELSFIMGAKGLIGSTSRIHSASGSSFIKAYRRQRDLS